MSRGERRLDRLALQTNRRHGDPPPRTGYHYRWSERMKAWREARDARARDEFAALLRDSLGLADWFPPQPVARTPDPQHDITITTEDHA